MSFKKWDVVWTYWIYHQNVKEFIESEHSKEWTQIIETLEYIKKSLTDNLDACHEIVQNSNISNCFDKEKLDISRQNLKNKIDDFKNKIIFKGSKILYRDKVINYLMEILYGLDVFDKCNLTYNQKIAIFDFNLLKKSEVDDYILTILNKLISRIKILKTESMDIDVIKGEGSKYRPCIVYHRSEKDYWVLPLSSSKVGYNEKFDVWIDEKSYVQVGCLTKIYETDINKRAPKINVSNECKEEIIKILGWFFDFK